MSHPTFILGVIIQETAREESRMTKPAAFTLQQILNACGDEGRTSAICINAELAPIGGAGAPVNPAIYSGRVYQHDKRWENPPDEEAADVIVIDNVPSQANRLEAALDDNAESIGIPRLILDLTGDEFAHLPPHLPRRISSLRFPHRNADAYLRDSLLNGAAFTKSDLGRDILDATISNAASLVAWFPQALLYGFWQSHLGKNRSQAKHARAWTSEIIGWHPATGGDPAEITGTRGTKGDPLNLQDEAKVVFQETDLLAGWEWVEGEKSGKTKGKAGKKTDALSNIGHGQVPFRNNELTPSAVSFKRISQSATCSFAQLRRLQLGEGYNPEQDAAARAVIVALGLHAHQLAFGRGFALRSGTDLVPEEIQIRLHDSNALNGMGNTKGLLEDAIGHAKEVGVRMDGWTPDPVILQPGPGLTNAIRGSWPALDGPDQTDGS